MATELKKASGQGRREVARVTAEDIVRMKNTLSAEIEVPADILSQMTDEDLKYIECKTSELLFTLPCDVIDLVELPDGTFGVPEEINNYENGIRAKR
jgi:hypothetical protein